MSALSDDDVDRMVFGSLLDISEKSLVLLASNIGKRVLHTPSPSGKYITRFIGSYNIVHIIQVDDIKVVIRIPATGWASGKTEAAAHALESQVATMRLIRERTTVPVPEVYDFDTTDNNEIGAPYMCMSFVSGKRVSHVWFEDPNSMSREEFRLKILKNLSQIMAQFSCLTFDKIGSIIGKDAGSITLGPCYDSCENSDGTFQIVSSGPFDSTSAYLKTHFEKSKLKDTYATAEEKVMQIAMPHSPITGSQNGFVLCHPDFNPQNVMVDEHGNVTGLIDWDLVQTIPRCVGYALYPSWITRDWDPLLYGWPHMPDSEDSPETLERYRAYYNEELDKVLNRQGDWKFTEKSHITQAVWIATLSSRNRLEICRKLVQEALGVDADEALGVIYDIGSNYYDEEDFKKLNIKLVELVTLL
ncbi:kinase-like protein [Hypoxylon crocopeplum]|nr:kinase-like protein [Hypoxylon crocopeplum]